MRIIMHVLAGLAMVSACFPASGKSANEPDRPNIIIMVADDIGYADPGFRGSEIETPSLDSLAADGLTLNRFYVAPICSPTRAALMTGRDPMRLGVAYGVILPWASGGVHTDEHFMPESFRAAGYQTAMVGKWHLGHSQQGFHPNARGFDHFYGHLHTEVGYYPPFNIVGGKDFQENGKTLSYDELGEEKYETFLLADHSSQWIKNRDKDKPFFLYLPFLRRMSRCRRRKRWWISTSTLRTIARPPEAHPMILRQSPNWQALRVGAPYMQQWLMRWTRQLAVF